MVGPKSIAVVTGAYGGIGRACARQLGRVSRLVLTDVDAKRLDIFADALEEEGYTVAARVPGDLSKKAVASALIDAASAAGPIGTVAHTAGLSPVLAGWEAILSANVVATELLLQGLERDLGYGLTAVLIASMAGHMATHDPALDEVIANPLAGDFLQKARALLVAQVGGDDEGGLASLAYAQSKRAVIRACEARATAWGAYGARIVSISPGTIWTPMGRAEAENSPAAARVVEATPMGRWGRALDISAAVEFLSSDAAGFITGCDLRVDGGVTPALRGGAI
jgi:NAD(P)-dependent dehydrogenase (short-subunit alcohol dehydrogenase family)